MRFWVFDEGNTDTDNIDNFCRSLSVAWVVKRDGGCPSCGKVRAQSIGYCKRCGKILRAVRDHGNPLRIIPSMFIERERELLASLSKAQQNAYREAKKLRDKALLLISREK